MCGDKHTLCVIHKHYVSRSLLIWSPFICTVNLSESSISVYCIRVFTSNSDIQPVSVIIWINYFVTKCDQIYQKGLTRVLQVISRSNFVTMAISIYKQSQSDFTGAGLQVVLDIHKCLGCLWWALMAVDENGCGYKSISCPGRHWLFITTNKLTYLTAVFYMWLLSSLPTTSSMIMVYM